MKTPGPGLAALTLILSGSLSFGGCYTQFYLTDSEPADETDTQPAFIDQPVVYVFDYLPPPILYGYPLFSSPVPVVTGHGNGRIRRRDLWSRHPAEKGRVPRHLLRRHTHLFSQLPHRLLHLHPRTALNRGLQVEAAVGDERTSRPVQPFESLYTVPVSRSVTTSRITLNPT